MLTKVQFNQYSANNAQTNPFALAGAKKSSNIALLNKTNFSDSVTFSAASVGLLAEKLLPVRSTVQTTGNPQTFLERQLTKGLQKALRLLGITPSQNPVKMMGQLTAIATRDGLSGLLNKRVHMVDMVRAVRTARETRQPLSVVVFDMDLFKSLNETLGHNVGDTVIKRIGFNIARVAEQSGVSGYRYGGEEFTLILPGQNKEQAAEMAREIAQKIKNDLAIQRHLGRFMAKNRSKLAKLERNQEAVDQILKALQQPSTSKIQDPTITGLKKVLRSILPQIPEERQEIVKKYLDEIERNPQSLKDKRLRFTVEGDETFGSIGKLLSTLTNRRREISEIGSWLNHHTETQAFTISAGVAEYPATRKLSPVKLFKLADKALVEGKHTRRNSINVHND
jgi:diguanylate cyclase (GGDEF)-like protein